MKAINQSVYILGSNRIPFAKSMTTYSAATRKDLMVAALNGLIQRFKLQNQLMGDVALGALFNSVADWNLARECVLSTELNPESPAYNVQRACGTSLETTWHIAMKIFTGSMEVGISGGVDTNSDMPIEVSHQLQRLLLQMHNAKSLSDKLKLAAGALSPKLLLPKAPTIKEPRTHLSMGDHCELMVKEWQISREEQDQIALLSHENASAAYQRGFYSDLVTPYLGLSMDNLVRSETSIQKLAKLKPAFDSNDGTLTAGNSSPLTDGSACVLLGTQQTADKLGITAQAKIIDIQVEAVNFVKGAGLLMAPTKAVAKLLARNHLTFSDFDFFEIHEAFAGQVLCNLKAWESPAYCRSVLGLEQALGIIDRKKLNVVGSSIAMGHPFAATGARIVGTLAKLLAQENNKRGLISICTAGGMGVAGILESA